ncbi:MAG: aldo/keto reductase [Spirochaetaceae bacterium]|jgi:predicted aldo/keto reductase-like oxidoreductase|nr:aldo/keto reductase [Spirochaetaceae bacterium]
MQYREDTKSGNRLSVLGFGCMRFGRTLSGAIDLKKAESLIVRAVEGGVNYFDTAYMYPGSEEALGAVLEKNGLREKVYVATKLPIAFCRGHEDFDKFFTQELKRLRTSYVDYYLLHMLTDLHYWETLKSWGIETWMEEKKKAGLVRSMGFSFHGIQGEFLKLLDAYPWDFCQIQYNYSDENFQAGAGGLKKAAEKMPVIIMEPLLGGRLARPPRAAAELFKKANPARSPAAWALNWIWDQKEAAVALSGMNEASQLEENLTLADAALPGMITGEEREVYRRVKALFNASYKIPCTGCNYCMPCPQNVNIPGSFGAYNTSFLINWFWGMQQYATSTTLTSEKLSSPRLCVKCGKCESRCPQHLPVIQYLGKVRRRMEPLPVRLIVAAARAVLRRNRKGIRVEGERKGEG